MPLQIWFFFILSACMSTSNSWSDSEGTLPFLSLLRKWKSHLPKKGKWLYGSSLNMQPGCQPSVPEGCFCGLAGEEPYPELSLYASSLFPQHLFPLPFWSMLPMQICFTPKTKVQLFWVGSDWMLCHMLSSSQSHSLSAWAFGLISTDVSFPGATDRASA